MSNSIVVGIGSDGWGAASRAARIAAALAHDLGRRLVLALVVDDPPVFPYGDGRRREVQRHQLFASGTHLLRALATATGEPTADTRLALSGLLRGGPAECLDAICREEDADLMVVGSLATAESATSATAVLTSPHLNPCPLLAVPPGARAGRDDRDRDASESLVVGLDGSSASNRAGRVARRLADRLRLRTIPLCVQRGDPKRALPDLAQRHAARLIVVGTRGCGARLGPVASHLVTSAPVPVLIVPRTARIPAFGFASEEADEVLTAVGGHVAELAS